MSPAMQAMVGTVLRVVLATVGGFLVTKGYIQPDKSDQFVVDALGVLLPLVAMVWGIIAKRKDHQVIVTAQAMPAGTTRQEVDTAIKMGEAPPITLKPDEMPLLESVWKASQDTDLP